MKTHQQLVETWKKKFVEEGAVFEHARWANWQNYLHSFLIWNNDIQAWVLPHEKKCHWQRQLETYYQMLSEKEKESDRGVVRVYLPLLTKAMNEAARGVVEAGKIGEPEKWADAGRSAAPFTSSMHRVHGWKTAITASEKQITNYLGDLAEKPNRWPTCPSPKRSDHCSGCTDPHSEGTHQGCTFEHGHVGCDLAAQGNE